MKNPYGALPLLLVVSLGLACGSSALNPQGLDASTAGGQGGTKAAGGATGSGGSNVGGNATGGAGGSSGTVCPTMGQCIACPNGERPNPAPCSCPICASPDASTPKDGATDGPPDGTIDACLALPCPFPLCSAGYQVVTPACGCPSCVPIDAGQPDTNACPPVACPAITCMNGTIPNPDPCGCPTCARPDAGPDANKLDCVGLDECACGNANGCAPIAERCYCPFPKCGASGACICGGGHFVGCAPVDLTTCTSAKDRVAALCPSLKGAIFDGLCPSSANPCTTKCLNEVTSCSDVRCSFCETCGCLGDPFSACVAACKTALGS
jgi:hypothetical protein